MWNCSFFCCCCFLIFISLFYTFFQLACMAVIRMMRHWMGVREALNGSQGGTEWESGRVSLFWWLWAALEERYCMGVREALNRSQGGFHCCDGCVQPSRRGFSVCVAARTLRRASRLCNRNCQRHKSKAVWFLTCVGVGSVIVKYHALPPCVLDGHSRNPLHYYYYYYVQPSVAPALVHVHSSWFFLATVACLRHR